MNTKRAGAEPDETITYFKVDTGEKVDDNEAVTVERAAADLAAYRASKHESAAVSISKHFAAEIDKLRGEVVDPEAPEPTEMPVGADEVTTEQPKADKTDGAADEAIDAMDGLDPETRKALKIPQVRQALEQQFVEVDQARQQYAGGLQVGQQMMQATVAALAPQLQGMPLEHWPQAIQQLAQVDPVRGQLVADTLSNWGVIQQAQQQAQQQQTYTTPAIRGQRQEYSKASDAVLGLTFAEKAEMAEELVNYVGELGISREAFTREAATNLALHHPAFQKMAADAIMYRRMVNAPKAVAHRDIPPVQRPGTAGPRVSSDQAAVSGLEAKFHRSGSAKDAAAALAARRKAAR